jgi:hypothetical protein
VKICRNRRGKLGGDEALLAHRARDRSSPIAATSRRVWVAEARNAAQLEVLQLIVEPHGQGEVLVGGAPPQARPEHQHRLVNVGASGPR